MAIARLSVKTGSVGKALGHAEYIDRDRKYDKNGNNDLEYSEYGNMPSWAEHNPLVFWQSADLYERKNGSTYREYEISLPRELSEEQRIALIKEFIADEIGKKYPYQLAIHNPKAMDGGEQPHAHLMFNERLQDGIDRDPEQYFKRYNSKNPEKGGAKKDNTGKDYLTRKDEIKELRQRWEDLSNKHLELAGSTERIDMRSYKDQGIEKDPEKKLLPSQAKDPEIREALQQSRIAYKKVEGLDLGDLKKELYDLKDRPVTDNEIKQGIDRIKADFKDFKKMILEHYQEQQKLEREPVKEQDSRGIER